MYIYICIYILKMHMCMIYLCVDIEHQNRTLEFFQPSGCKNPKVRFWFSRPYIVALIISGIRIYIFIYLYTTTCSYIHIYTCTYVYIYIYKCVLYECRSFIKMLRLRVSELLPDIRDLLCGCRTVEIRFCISQLMSKPRKWFEHWLNALP